VLGPLFLAGPSKTTPYRRPTHPPPFSFCCVAPMRQLHPDSHVSLTGGLCMSAPSLSPNPQPNARDPLKAVRESWLGSASAPLGRRPWTPLVSQISAHAPATLAVWWTESRLEGGE
jgi:hypothetical protein